MEGWQLLDCEACSIKNAARLLAQKLYREASAQGIPERVTDRMLKRIGIFSGVPLLLGFSTGPIFYGLKMVAHVDVAPW